MFLAELKFAADCLIGWLVKKFKSVYLEIEMQTKSSYESNIPLDCNEGKSLICTFLLFVDVKGFDSLTAEMIYYDFIIQKGHKFLQDVYNPDVLKRLQIWAHQLTSTASFLNSSKYRFFWKIVTQNNDFDQISEVASLKDFFYYIYPNSGNFKNLLYEIDRTEVKRSFKKSPFKKIWKIMAFACTRIMQCPYDNFIIPNILTKTFPKVSIKWLFKSSASFICYGENSRLCARFSNWNARENWNFFCVYSAQLFWVGFFFLVRCIHWSIWWTKDFSVGGTKLINLAGLAETGASEEKVAITKLPKNIYEHTIISKVPGAG